MYGLLILFFIPKKPSISDANWYFFFFFLISLDDLEQCTSTYSNKEKTVTDFFFEVKDGSLAY